MGGLNFKRVKKIGDEIMGHCPFHDDAHPSFYYNVKKGVYHCFACGAKGRVGDSSVDLMQYLLSDYDSGNKEFEQVIYPETVPVGVSLLARNYLETRGISIDLANKFGITYSTSMKRLIIPIDKGYIGRSVLPSYLLNILKQTKYLYPRGFKKSWHVFWGKVGERIMLVEGVFDCIRMYVYGIPSCAILGTDISIEQVGLLLDKGVKELVVAMDGDDAGREGAERIMRGCRAFFKVHVAQLDCDPDELSRDRAVEIYERSDLAEYKYMEDCFDVLGKQCIG